MLQKRPSCVKQIVNTWDLHLLKDFRFVHMSLGLGLGYVSSISFSTFFPMFLQDEVHFDMWQTTTCMTALSAADIAGRMTIPEIFRKLNMGNRSQFMIGAVLLGFTRSSMCYFTISNYFLKPCIYSSGKLDVVQYGSGSISDCGLCQEYHSNQPEFGGIRVHP